jgi:ketosteroid isomerase-like protein
MSQGRDVVDNALIRMPTLAGLISRGAMSLRPGSTLRELTMRLIVRRGFAAMARSDVGVVLLYYAPDAEVRMYGSIGVDVGERHRGHEAIRQLYADFDDAWAEWNWAIRSLVDLGDRVAIQADFQAKGRYSGVDLSLANGGTAIGFLPSGKITWQKWFVEPDGWNQARRAVGLSE